MKEKDVFPINTATSCPLKWNWNTLYLTKGISLSCHRASANKITIENFENFHNSEEKITARKKMLSGLWPSSDNNKYDENYCGYCRKIEDAGGFSDRQFHSKYTNDTPDELKKNPLSLSVTPKILEVYFSNECNLACNYCKSDLSSKLESEDRKWGYFKKNEVEIIPLKEKNNKELIPLFWKWFEKNGDHLSKLIVMGGEPFYQKECDELLSHLDKFPKPEMELQIITNLMITKNKLIYFIEKVKNLLKKRKIKSFILICSIDCWGPQQEYVRLGLNLKTWEDNFLYLLENKWIYLCTLSTVTPLTIKTMPELFIKINQWKKNFKIHQQMGGFVGPEYMKSEIFGQGFFTKDIEKILNLMPENNEEEIIVKEYTKGIFKVIDGFDKNEFHIKNFMTYIKEKDRRRNTDYKLVFPW